jgi:hypothetical protein
MITGLNLTGKGSAARGSVLPFQASLRDAVPLLVDLPGVETPGYFRMSLPDKDKDVPKRKDTQ